MGARARAHARACRALTAALLPPTNRRSPPLARWDFNCLPYLYTRYSVAGYGTSTRALPLRGAPAPFPARPHPNHAHPSRPRGPAANYWKIQQYCGGDVNNASPENDYCYTCEPPSANETDSDFNFFPEPAFSPTWQAAVAYVTAGAASAPVQPTWDAGFISGQQWTDPNTGISSLLPGSGLYNTLKRDPYADFVSLAKDLGAAGVDIDYEEDWHADFHKQGPAGGPWTLPQTVYKYSAILKDVQLNIAAQAPGMLLSSPTGAASGWAGNWWGGNLKGLVIESAALYPDLIAFVASTGGINVMVRALHVFARPPSARPRTPPPLTRFIPRRTTYRQMRATMSAQHPQSAACTIRSPFTWPRTPTPPSPLAWATRRAPRHILTPWRTPRTSCLSP